MPSRHQIVRSANNVRDEHLAYAPALLSSCVTSTLVGTVTSNTGRLSARSFHGGGKPAASVIFIARLPASPELRGQREKSPAVGRRSNSPVHANAGPARGKSARLLRRSRGQPEISRIEHLHSASGGLARASARAIRGQVRAGRLPRAPPPVRSGGASSTLRQRLPVTHARADPQGRRTVPTR